MICFPNAKINLGLRIIEKRPDGYHNLETVFYPIGLKDVLEAVPSPTDKETPLLSVTGPDASFSLGNVADNLVIRAYRLLQSKYRIPSLSFYLYKGIPSGAGLGGGSSDAASTLRIINETCSLGLSENQLEAFSAQLGADCAFFIKNKPIFASGIGNTFEDISLKLCGYYLILIKPELHVSTAEAYSLVHPAKPKTSLKETLNMPVDQWKYLLFNDFEVSVFEKYPSIREIKETLYQKGALYASMSGSGSSVFGLFNNPVDLKQTFPDCFYWSEKLG